MVSFSLVVPARAVCGLRRHAVAAGAVECCGAVFGTLRTGAAEVRSVIPLPDAAVDETSYAIDADRVLQLEQLAHRAGLQLIGFYHSHPSAPATPSAADLELACPGFIYFIIEAASGDVRAWRLRDDRASFHEVDLTPLAGAA